MFINQALKKEEALATTFLFYCTRFVQIQRNKLFFSMDWFFIKQMLFALKRQRKANDLENEIKGKAEDSRKNFNTLHIEISSEKINDLLKQNKICAADIRCLDVSSKQCLKQLCLKTCLYNTNQSHALNELPMPNENCA
jgi:hypothetical protein